MIDNGFSPSGSIGKVLAISASTRAAMLVCPYLNSTLREFVIFTLSLCNYLLSPGNFNFFFFLLPDSEPLIYHLYLLISSISLHFTCLVLLATY